MIEVGYRRENLFFQSIGCLALAAGGVWFARLDTGYLQLTLLGWLIALAMPFVAYATFRRALDGALALREVSNGIEINTLYASQNIAWRDLQSVHRESLTQSGAFGLIKQTIAGYLVFAGRNRSGEDVVIKLHEDLLNWPKAELHKLEAQVIERWARGELEGQAMAPALKAPSPATPSFGRRSV